MQTQRVRSFVHTLIDILCTAAHTHRYTPSPSQTTVSNSNLRVRQAHTQNVAESPRVTLNTHSRTRMQTHTVHNWSHTQAESQSLSHTDRHRAVHSHTQRETDTHSCTQTPGDVEQWTHCLGWQQLGRKEQQCGRRRPWGLLYPPPHSYSILQTPSFFQRPDSAGT